MMKKLLLLLAAVMGFASVSAQNVQMHYDFGRNFYDELSERPLFTSTVEMFHPDGWGSTFFFVDMDYTSKGVASAYWEIAREFRFWKAPVSIHVEYNGGTTNRFSLNNAYLFGATYTYNNKNFSSGFSLTASYKYIEGHQAPHNYQFTGTWYVNFGQRGICSFNGFVDFWREKNYANNTSCIFLSEPQFWVNLHKIKGVNEKFKLSIGTEVELSNNFGGRKGFYAIPTIAVKWSFN